MTEKAGENMIEKEKPKKATDMEGVRLVAKGLLSTEIHDTEYAPLIISHPFANSGIVFLPGENGQEMPDSDGMQYFNLEGEEDDALETKR